MWTTAALTITEHDKKLLQQLAHAPSTPQGIAIRARIVLASEQGIPNSTIAKEFSTSRPTIDRWKNRFKERGVPGLLHIADGRGRKPEIPERKIEEIIEDTLHTTPPDSDFWSSRDLAKKHAVSHKFVQKVWYSHGLKPWLVKKFKLSNDKHFIDKLRDVVGLYLNPPDHAIVFSLDEKTQIQALERTQKALPIAKGHAKTQTHDYTRHGTTSLFAALNILKGKVIGMCRKKHRHQEFIAFLDKIDQAVAHKYEVHCIVDNYSTHKHAAVKEWLRLHPRFHFHFIPTSSSWLNLVERWFGEITRKRIRRSSFTSVEQLIEAIMTYIAETNAHPKPFIWTKSADEIIAKVNKCKAILNPPH